MLLNKIGDDAMSVGIVYIATGKKYIEEACKSAASLKNHMPKMPITIFSSEEIESSDFDRVVIIKNPKYGFYDKVANINKSPYDTTLFLDTDTWICHDFSEIFALLKNFDIATAHAPVRITYQIDETPNSFPEMNTGVILFKKSPQINKLFDNWLTLFKEQMEQVVKPRHDQPAFREALFKSQLKVTTLTPEYNCRFIIPTFISGKVKILHGRCNDLSIVAKKINSKTTPRFFVLKSSLQSFGANLEQIILEV